MALATPVTIPDAAFYTYLHETLVEKGIITPETLQLTDDDLAQLDELDYSGDGKPVTQKILNLEGIQYCVNVTDIYFPYNNLTTLPDLSALTDLQILDLNNNQINDLSNVSNLPSSLTTILLNTNQIATLSSQDSFSHLINLESLQLGDNQISDISSLAGLPNSISQLLLFNNQITDLSALAGLTSLTELQLYMNTDLTDITPLANLTNLQKLYISDTKVTTVTSLKKLVNLTELWLHYNQIQSINGLEDMTKLTLLTLNQNQIHDISPLKAVTNLTILDLYTNEITDITPLQNMTELQTLTLHDNQISDISALADKTELISLTLDNNHVCDLSPLKGSPLTQKFSATNQTVHLPNIILHTYRLILPYPVKDQHGEAVPPSPQQWTYYNETPHTISWDNCYGWGTRTFNFENESHTFSGQIHIFYQTFIPLNRHYTYYRH